MSNDMKAQIYAESGIHTNLKNSKHPATNNIFYNRAHSSNYSDA